jgi:hypothetical protein
MDDLVRLWDATEDIEDANKRADAWHSHAKVMTALRDNGLIADGVDDS